MSLPAIVKEVAIRVAAPDGTRVNESLPVLVLPEGTKVRGLTLSYLACGGMSVAYKGRRDDGGFRFVKEVPNSQPQAVMALAQEKALLERLRHPGIVKVHDLFEWRDHQYLVQDFIEGGNLEQQLSPFPDIYLSEAVVRGWALELCAIFEYLHSQQPPIIYRDLKPKNVLRDTAGRLFLVDFGIARAFKAGKEQDTRLLGSVLTASPEHYGGQTDVRSDLYTLGATLHYLLTNGRGERVSPFDFPPIRALNRTVSADFERIILRCLERQPEQRYQSVSELRRALAGQSVAPAPTEAPASAPLPAPAPAGSSTPGWPLLVAGLVLGIGLTLLLQRPGKSPPPSPSATPVALLTMATKTSPSPISLEPAPVATLTPLPVAVRPHPRPTRSAAPVTPPRPVTPPSPSPIELPQPRPIGQPSYPVARPSNPPSDPIPSPQEADPAAILQDIGPPWEGVERLRDLQVGNLRNQRWVDGPQGLFRLPVPQGYKVVGDAEDFSLVHLDGLNTRVVRFRTLAGVYCDPDLLFERRRQQMPQWVMQTRTLRVGGKTVSALVLRMARRHSKLEEVFWSHSDPDWTVAVAAGSTAKNFDEFQTRFENILQSWNP